MRRKLLTLAQAVCVFLSPAVCLAISGVGISGYAVTTWGPNEGAPDAVIYALAQDQAGYLWLGTGAGLLRFDGVRFKAWSALSGIQLPPGPVQALYASRDGSLWVGFQSDGHLSHLRGNVARNFTHADGLPALPIIAIVEDEQGVPWIASDAGLFFLNGETWTKWRTGRGLPDAPAWATHIARDGSFFVTTPGGLYRRKPQASQFDEMLRFGSSPSPGPLSSASVAGFLPATMVRSIVSDADQRIFLSDFRAGYHRVQPSESRPPERVGRGLQLIIDRRAALWVATSGQGVWRVQDPAAAEPMVERITAATGLASEGAFSLFEDRDGNIWAGGTPNGLTRLTPHKVLPFIHEAIVNALAMSGPGTVWIGTSDGLFEVPDPDRHPLVEQHRFSGFSVRAMHTDSQGALWIATERQLLRLPSRQAGPPLVVKGSEQLRQVDSITSHPLLGVLVSDADRGLLRWNGHDGFSAVALPTDVQGARILTTYADTRGRIWISLVGGRIVLLDREGKCKLLGTELDAGDYRVIREDDHGVVWLGGTTGISRYQEGRVVTIHGDDRFPIRRVRAVLQDRRGWLWIATTAGIFGVDSAALTRVVDEASYGPPYVQYDKSDGLAGLPQLLSDSPALRTKGGALWFVTSNGITIVQPRSGDEPLRPSIATVDSVSVDDRQVTPQHDLTLPAGSRRLQIDFGSLNLTTPQKTRFKVRLEGVDAAWVDVGGRRQASYTNLAPSNYRFRVAATDALGGWSPSEAEWDFSVAPRFYQTRIFALVCTGLVCLIAAFAWKIRLSQERRRFSLILAERARLSREIHDTLLQGLVGVGLQCDALGSDLEHVAPATQERFLRLRRDTQRYIKEARHAIWSLRSSRSQHEDLPTIVRRLGDRVTAVGGAFSVVVNGPAVALEEDVERQLARIAEEAITNAAHHAVAKHCEVRLDYSHSEVVLRIADDGCGFTSAAPSEAAGHYGLLSMRERAESIGATFTLESAAGRGTVVEARVPLQQHRSLATQRV